MQYGLSILIAAGFLSLGTVFVRPANAQVICPPGTYVVASSGRYSRARCVRGRAPRSTRTAKRAADKRKRKDDGKTITTTLGCAEFNAKFSTFHLSYSKRFGTRAFRQDRLVKQLRSLIVAQRRLVKELRTQAMYARDVRVRRHLMSQAKEAAGVMRQKKKELAEVHKSNKQRSKKWTSNYKSRARKLLTERPKGCKVRAAK